MKKIFSVLLMTILLAGCSNSKTMEDVFHNEIKNMGNVNAYNLIEQVERDNVILFSASIEGGEENSNLLQIAFFNKVNNEWTWQKTTSCSDKWSVALENKPYIWCGTLTEPRHQNVYVGDAEANITEVDGGNRRVWYHLNEDENKAIKVVSADGSEEWLKK